MASGAEGLDTRLRAVSLEGATSSSRLSASTGASEDPSARTFELELVAKSAPGRGAVATCAAAAGGLVVVGTSAGICTVHDFADGSSRDVDCASLARGDRHGSSSPSVAGIGSDALGRLTLAFGASSSANAAAQNQPRNIAVAALWLDPTGAHCVVTLRDASDGSDAGWGYFHARSWRRLKSLAAPSPARAGSVTPRSARETPAATNPAVTALGWRPDACDGRVARDVLVGTSDGCVHEMSIDAACGEDGPRRPDKGCRMLIDLSRDRRLGREGGGFVDDGSVDRAVRGIRTCVGGGGACVVLVATADRLRCFTGGDTLARTLQGVGGAGPRGGGVDPLVSMPSMGSRGESNARGFELHAWHHGRGGVGARADRMAWLVGGCGVYYGHLDVAGHDPRAADTVLQNHSLVPFPHGACGESDGAPLSMAPTRHHVLVAFARRLVAVNAVTGDLALDLDPVEAVNRAGGGVRVQAQAQVQVQAQAKAGDTPGSDRREVEDAGDNACLATDEVVGVSFLVTTRGHVLKVVARDEDKDAWRSYLARHDFARALSHCRTASQREEVHCAQAERAMAVNDAGKAARCYAKAGDFIDADVVVNIFKNAHEMDALETYLRRRLDLREADGAPAGDPAARQLAAWLLDLNVARCEDAARSPPTDDSSNDEFVARGRLQHFIHEHGARLDFDAAHAELTRRGLADDAAHLREAAGDWNGAARHWLSVRRDPGEAARVFRNPRMPPDARLAHARALFDLDPATAVDAFVVDDDLDPARLATEVFEGVVAGDESTGDPRGAVAVGAARYLTHAVTRGRGEVNTVDRRRLHDLALRAFVRVYPADPGALIGYVRDGFGTDSKTGEPLYDPVVAADLCERVGAIEAAMCVHCDRGDQDAALALAMAASDDLALAKSVLDRAGRRSRSRFGVSRRDIWRKIAAGAVARGFGAKVTEADVVEAADALRKYEETFGNGGGEGADGDGEVEEEERADPKLGTSRRAAEAYAVSRACAASSSYGDPSVRKRVVDRIVSLVEESDGELGVDDVLPLFPDFRSMEEWRDAVLNDLAARDGRVDAHVAAAAEARAKIDAAKRTLEELRTREAVIGWDEPCARCGGSVSSPPFSFHSFASEGTDPDEVDERCGLPKLYVFPCGMCFHATCLLESAVPRLGRRRRGEATALMDAIDVPLTFGLREMRRRLREKDGKAREGVVGDGGPGREGADAVARLDEILRERCPFCGEVEFSG